MAKKKKQFPKRNRNIAIGALVSVLVVALIVGGSVGIYAWDQNRRSWIGTVHGERVSAGEFRLNLLEQQIQFESEWGWDVWMNEFAVVLAKEEAFSRTMSTRLAAMRAAEYGADFLTPEQEEHVEMMVDAFINLYDPAIMRYIGLSEEELRRALADSFYAENLFLRIGEERYVHDEEAMLEAFNEFFEANQYELTRYAFFLIMHDDYELMQDIRARIDAGEDFYTLMAAYCLEYQFNNPPPPEGFEDENAEQGDEYMDSDNDGPAYDIEETDEILPFDDGFFNDEEMSDIGIEIDWDEILADWDPNLIDALGSELLETSPDMAAAVFAMEPGEISDIITVSDPSGWMPDFYMIVNLTRVVAPDFDTELSRFEHNVFIPSAKSAIVMEVFEQWTLEADIQRNDRAFDTITIFMH